MEKVPDDTIYVKLDKEITGKKLPYYDMNPRKEIKDVMSRDDWVGGFSIAVSYFELHACMQILPVFSHFFLGVSFLSS